MSVSGGITPDELLRLFVSLSGSNGFGNRFLWQWSDSHLLLPDGGAPDNTAIDAAIARIPKERVKRALTRTDEAAEYWRDTAYRRWRQLGDNPVLGDLFTRASDHVQRIALIYAVLDGANHVTLQHLLAGEAWVNRSTQTVRGVFGYMKRAITNPLAGKLLDSLRRHPGRPVPKTELFDAVGRNHTAAEMNAAIEDLEQAGLAFRWDGVPDGGRPPVLVIATVAGEERR